MVKVKDLFKSLFESMINFNVSPKIFNVAIIKPLIKNPKKSSYDADNHIGHLQPYFWINQSTERNKCHNNDQKQFGFKP